PIAALARLLQDAHKRIDEEQPPTPVAPESWFPDTTGANSADGPPR
ncbi:MAG: hypothetical protein H0X69_11715, partial [Gemmatimonadales bacterium]|nr:hypothetical protein [Gemmatimonadales bacterium]